VIGRLDNVVQEEAGAAVTTAALAGDTTLLVDETLPFSDSRQLTVAETIYAFTITSDTTLELDTPLAVDVGEGASVAPLDVHQRPLTAWYAEVFLDDDDKPARALIPSRDVPYFTTEFACGDNVEVQLVDRRWRVVTRPVQQPIVDMTGVFASSSQDNDTRVTITIALNPFGLGQDWALIEFWADDPGLAPGKVWSRFNPDDGYASLTVASPAVAGAEAEAAQLILSKNLDGEQLATLIAHQVTMAANEFQIGSLDGSSIDFHTVGSSLIQFFSNAYAPPQGFLNINLGDSTRHVIAAWASEGIRKTLRLKGASIEFDDEETGTTTTVADLLARISDLEDRVSALEGP
jgi:hypothetical protein